MCIVQSKDPLLMIFGLHICVGWTAHFALWTSQIGWTARLKYALPAWGSVKTADMALEHI